MDIKKDSPWAITDAQFPKFGTRGERLKHLLRYAVLAYSPFNSQPWQFRIKHDTAEIHVDTARQLQSRDPDCRQAILACGAALGNLAVACRYFGFEPNINLLTGKLNSSLVATVALGALVEPTTEIIHWFENITQLELGMGPFKQGGPMPATLVPLISRIAKNYSVRIKNIEQQEKAILKIVEVASEREGNDPNFQNEYRNWLRNKQISIGDGLPPAYFGVTGIGAILGRRYMAHLNTGKGLAKAYRQIVNTATGGFILTTESDSPDKILEAGIVLQQSLLAMRTQGLAGVICAPPIDINPLRQDLGKRFCEGRMPQALVLFGTARKPGVLLPKRAFESNFEEAFIDQADS